MVKVGNHTAIQKVLSVPNNLVSHCNGCFKFKINDKSSHRYEKRF